MCEHVRVWACVRARNNVIVRGKERKERDKQKKNGEKIGEKSVKRGARRKRRRKRECEEKV